MFQKFGHFHMEVLEMGKSWRLRSVCGGTHNADSAAVHSHSLCGYLGVKVKAFMFLPCPINTIQCGMFDAMCWLELSFPRVYFS